jgi:ribosome biogenesis GTPase / thiamine phosphate phosphatase
VPALESLGFGPFFSSQLTPEERETLLPGRAVADRGRRLSVQLEDGERLVTVPARLRVAGATPVVGDFVLATRGEEPAVVRVLGRRSKLSRNVSGRETAEQVLAANVDVVFVVNALDAGVNPRRLERTLAAVYGGGAEPVIVLTKPDLCDDADAARQATTAAAPGVPVVVASGLTGEGVAALAALLAAGRTGVVTGPSGAGKSTIVNALVGRELQETAPVLEDDARGRHTTTGRQLFALPSGGAIVDGPGIRELRLWDPAGIASAFEDVAALAALCRFRDCEHAAEPGCAVRAAVETGALDAGRVESLRKLEREAAAQQARAGSAADRADRQRGRAVTREPRRFNGRRGRE